MLLTLAKFVGSYAQLQNNKLSQHCFCFVLFTGQSQTMHNWECKRDLSDVIVILLSAIASYRYLWFNCLAVQLFSFQVQRVDHLRFLQDLKRFFQELQKPFQIIIVITVTFVMKIVSYVARKKYENYFVEVSIVPN